MLKVNCTATTTTVTESETLVSGRVGLQIEFSFSSEWEGLNKTACFRGENDYEVILNDNTIEVPWEALSASGYPLYVGAIGKTADGTIVIPTTWCKVGRIQQGVGEENGATPQPPTPDIVSQIQQTAANARATSLEAIDKAVNTAATATEAKNTASTALATAQRAEQKADSIKPYDDTYIREQLNENTDNIAELNREMAGAATVVAEHTAELAEHDRLLVLILRRLFP